MISFPPRAQAVDNAGRLTPEFWRALRGSASPIGHMYMVGNATPSTSGKVQGTTTAGTCYAFDHTTGRLTYTGADAATLAVSVSASLTSTAGDKVGISVARNGTKLREAFATVGTGTSCVSVVDVVSLVTGDYIDVYVSGANPVTVTDLSVTLR